MKKALISMLLMFPLIINFAQAAEDKVVKNEEYLWHSDEPIKVSFETNGYSFYKGCAGLVGTPEQAFLKLVAVKKGEKVILLRTTSLEGYVKIKNEAEALEFVRLFTNLDTQYLFEDSDWIELNNLGTDVLAGIPFPGAILKNEFEDLGLFEPRIKKQDNSFMVERCLLNSKHEVFQSREIVTENGEYKMEVARIIAKRADIAFPTYF